MTSGAAIPDADNPAGADPEGYRAALEAIKAIHAAGGTLLSKAETVEFLSRFIWRGQPEPAKFTAKGTPVKSGNSGPKSKRTQYDDAVTLRKDLYRRLVTAPNARRIVSVEKICEVFDSLVLRTPQHLLIGAVEHHLVRLGMVASTRANIRKALVGAGKWPVKPE